LSASMSRLKAIETASDPDTAARVWWSLASSPGDPVVGQLIASLGASAAASAVCSGSSPQLISSRVPDLVPEDIHWLRQRLSFGYDEASVAQLIRCAIQSAIDNGYRILTPLSKEWPQSLHLLGPSAPTVLYCTGRIGLLSTDVSRVALVGTRRASSEGLAASRKIVRALIGHGFVSVSGGARGIDTAVHRASLDAEKPTIVVGATCLEQPYPPENTDLFAKAGRIGLVLSETPLGKAVSAKSFLARNRLIAALSDATIVVEAPIRSGALNTASHARMIGRSVYAVRYPKHSASNAGARRLVDEWGAVRIEVDSGIVGTGLSP
jgi:DNA processing protein